MTAQIIIEFIARTWWAFLLFIVIAGYYFYSLARYYAELNKFKNRKKELEQELAGLKTKFAEKAEQLEKKLSEKNRFLKKE